MLLLLTISISAQTQQRRKFDPERFKQDQEAFITKEARLSASDASAFFPLFHEMQDKKRALQQKQRNLSKQQPANDKQALQLINQMDEVDAQVARLQGQYHKRMCSAIGARKVMQCLRADDRFTHQLMSRIAQPAHHGNKQKQE